jgi:hypothetical protein
MLCCVVSSVHEKHSQDLWLLQAANVVTRHRPRHHAAACTSGLFCTSHPGILALQEWHGVVWQQHCTQLQQRQLQQAESAQTMRALQQAWAAWRQCTNTHSLLASRQRCRHLLQAAFSTWAQLPAVNLHMRAIAAAVGSVYRQLQLQWGFRGFMCCCSDAVAARRAARASLRAWCAAAAACARRRQIVRARVEARRRRVLHRCLQLWLRAAWLAHRQAAAVQASDLQVMSLTVDPPCCCRQ